MLPLAVTIFGFTFSGMTALVIAIVVVVIIGGIYWLMRGRR